MYPALGRRYGVTPSVHRRNPLHRWAGHSGGAGGRHQSPRLGPWGRCHGRGVRTGGRIRFPGGSRAGCILCWGGAAVSPRRYTGGTHSTGELGTRGAPVAAANRRGWAPGGAAAAGVCAQAGEFGFRGVGPDVSCAGAALRCHPVGTPAEPTPQVGWALGGRRWPPPIATVGPLGALPRPGCAHRRANSVSGG